MVAITVPAEEFSSLDVSELKQISLESDGDIGAANDLLTGGWKLLLTGHLSDRTVYVPAKTA